MNTHWQPTASLKNLRFRAKIYAKIREFFRDREILEVETPLLSQFPVTDPHVNNFATSYQIDNQQHLYYLQTSPEYAMKRLLAAGMGPIYQISKAFRNGECGHQHNPEFSMLEWYRPDFDHHQLMDEVDLFLQTLLSTQPAKRTSYQQLFQDQLQIDPLSSSRKQLQQCLIDNNIELSSSLQELETDACLQLLLTHLIEPKLGINAPAFIYDFPSSQAMLARIRYDESPVAQRFEVYINGIEIANGFHELNDAKEQLQRFQHDQQYRQQNHLPNAAIDQRLIKALEHGLPNCSGVAVGIDRLMMFATGTSTIKDVIAFPWERA